MKLLYKSELPSQWIALIDLCETINFGQVENIEIRDGLPLSYSASVKTVMPGPNKDNGPAQASSAPASPLKPQWADVLALALSKVPVRIRRLEVAHGCPLKLHLESAGGAFHG